VCQTTLSPWVLADGDSFTTNEGFIFNVFGYEHPPKRVFAFLKYIPAKFKPLFGIDYLERTWKYRNVKLFRAEQLYTARNYQALLEAFRKSFPEYVYFCPFRRKEVISAPRHCVKKAYVPKQCLRSLVKLKRKDSLQKTTLDFVELLSKESSIGLDDFGVHGSVALGMHSPKSDIDIVVYGAENFRRLEKTIDRLVNDGTVRYQFNNRLDAARRSKGRYRNRVFMYNAIRKPEEVNVKYGRFSYSPVKALGFSCTVRDDSEAMFRPATYEIGSYQPADTASALPKDTIPQLVVSNVGCYRNVARQGDKIRVAGMLERVENLETSRVFYQVVVGTGTSEEEYICPA